MSSRKRKAVARTRPPEVAQSPARSSTIRPIATAVCLTTLAALISSISQLSLAPVFGSIPASIYHTAAIASSFLSGNIVRIFWKPRRTTFLQYLPLWAACMPMLQFAVFLLSEKLEIVTGPILAGFLSCHTIIIVLGYAVMASIEQIHGSIGKGPSSTAPIIVALVVLSSFMFAESWISNILPNLLGVHLNPLNLQVLSSLALGAAMPQRQNLFYATVVAANFVALLAPQGSGPYSLAVANTGLAPANWTLLARQWSNSGYISVLENTDQQYRVLRCDHSLLGGEWQLTPERRNEGWQVAEPIYAVFEMLEAVRLMRLDGTVLDKDAKALVIGLGIGTAPKALIAHGIETTIVELDPIVHQYATNYFSLPSAHTPVLSDAITWVHNQANHNATLSPIYDYILHDVFTGGAEPLDLFTTTFLSNLRSLLAPNGVAAINYAGDLSLPLTARVLNTIDLAFNRQCRAFRDQAPGTQSEGEAAADFSNLVVFCRNTPGPITFRRPTEADLLQSQSRRQYLLPKQSLAVDFPLRDSPQEAEVLLPGEVGQWRSEQQASATRHWRIMRTVLPARVWEMY